MAKILKLQNVSTSISEILQRWACHGEHVSPATETRTTISEPLETL